MDKYIYVYIYMYIYIMVWVNFCCSWKTHCSCLCKHAATSRTSSQSRICAGRRLKTALVLRWLGTSSSKTACSWWTSRHHKFYLHLLLLCSHNNLCAELLRPGRKQAICSCVWISLSVCLMLTYSMICVCDVYTHLLNICAYHTFAHTSATKSLGVQYCSQRHQVLGKWILG